MKTAAVTQRQSDVLAAIAGFIEEEGYQPSYQQIGARVGLASVATVFKHITNLQRKGYITKSHNRRDMKITRKQLRVPVCPTCGQRKTA